MLLGQSQIKLCNWSVVSPGCVWIYSKLSCRTKQLAYSAKVYDSEWQMYNTKHLVRNRTVLHRMNFLYYILSNIKTMVYILYSLKKHSLIYVILLYPCVISLVLFWSMLV